MRIYDPDLEVGSRLERVLSCIGDEVLRAQARFDPFNSPHEGWAVIREELDELWDEVKANRGRMPDAKVEAIQVAAMAVRYVLDLPPVSGEVER